MTPMLLPMAIKNASEISPSTYVYESSYFALKLPSAAVSNFQAKYMQLKKAPLKHI